MVTKKQMVRDIDKGTMTRLSPKTKKSLMLLSTRELRLIWRRFGAEAEFRRKAALATARFKKLVKG